MEEKLSHLDGKEIDDILNEIDKNANTIIDWNNVIEELDKRNASFIKTLISANDIKVNDQNPSNGMTLLMYAIVVGNIELVGIICNFGANINICDNNGDNALSYAMKYGRYKITEMIYFRQLSGSLGNDIKQIKMKIYQKNQEAELLMKFYQNKKEAQKHLIQFIIECIENNQVFGQDILYYSWYFVLKHDRSSNSLSSDDSDRQFWGETPLESKLFKTLMNEYDSILKHTGDKKRWKWLKENIINSLLWYLPNPRNDSNDDAKTDNKQDEKEDEKEDDQFYASHMEGKIVNKMYGDAIDVQLRRQMFYELLYRVRAQSKVYSSKCLEMNIKEIKLKKPDEWKQLTSYNVKTKNARQDYAGCLIPIYTENDLSEDIYPPSTHFNAKKHYDKNMYLNELLFRCNILNDRFQQDMKTITKEISSELGYKIPYRAGPVKTLIRSQAKVENDYLNEAFPTSAKILDINRCALQFDNIQTLMAFLKIFADKVHNEQGRAIVDIVRCKNGWNSYDPNYPSYTDIKLNVLIQAVNAANDNISVISCIGEVQLLLDIMSSFKRIAHKLYAVERKYEMVYNYGVVGEKMDKFQDNKNMKEVLFHLIWSDDLKGFMILWNLKRQNVTIRKLMKSRNFCFFAVMGMNGKILNFLKTQNNKTYVSLMKKYMKTISTVPDIISKFKSQISDRFSAIQCNMIITSAMNEPQAFDNDNAFNLTLNYYGYYYKFSEIQEYINRCNFESVHASKQFSKFNYALSKSFELFKEIAINFEKNNDQKSYRRFIQKGINTLYCVPFDDDRTDKLQVLNHAQFCKFVAANTKNIEKIIVTVINNLKHANWRIMPWKISKTKQMVTLMHILSLIADQKVVNCILKKVSPYFKKKCPDEFSSNEWSDESKRKKFTFIRDYEDDEKNSQENNYKWPQSVSKPYGGGLTDEEMYKLLMPTQKTNEIFRFALEDPKHLFDVMKYFEDKPIYLINLLLVRDFKRRKNNRSIFDISPSDNLDVSAKILKDIVLDNSNLTHENKLKIIHDLVNTKNEYILKYNSDIFWCHLLSFAYKENEINLLIQLLNSKTFYFDGKAKDSILDVICLNEFLESKYTKSFTKCIIDILSSDKMIQYNGFWSFIFSMKDKKVEGRHTYKKKKKERNYKRGLCIILMILKNLLINYCDKLELIHMVATKWTNYVKPTDGWYLIVKDENNKSCIDYYNHNILSKIKS